MNCLLILAAVAFVSVLAAPQSSYTTKYDTVDIDRILANKRLTDSYVKCLLDEGNCTEEGRTLKSLIPDALVTSCSKCNNVQRSNMTKIVGYLYKKRRTDFDRLVAKYDPQGTYLKRNQAQLDKL